MATEELNELIRPICSACTAEACIAGYAGDGGMTTLNSLEAVPTSRLLNLSESRNDGYLTIDAH